MRYDNAARYLTNNQSEMALPVPAGSGWDVDVVQIAGKVRGQQRHWPQLAPADVFDKELKEIADNLRHLRALGNLQTCTCCCYWLRLVIFILLNHINLQYGAGSELSMSSQARTEKAPRRSSYKATSEETLARKRARGETSCAECKRLKLKCDKQALRMLIAILRKYLAALACVEGAPRYAHMVASRLGRVLDTEQLHQKISEMSARIRQLEEALAVFQAGVSSDPHPLLEDELLMVKFGPEPQQSGSHEDFLAETMDAFGTITIGDGGEARYFGRSGGSEAGAEFNEEGLEKESFPPVTPDLLGKLASIFPMGIGCDSNSQTYATAVDALFASLPPMPRAWSLLEAYLENASWVFQPIRREIIIEDILTPIYNAKREHEDPEATGKAWAHLSPHKIAVLFLIFANGAVVDLTLPPYNAEGEEYYHYARAALTLRSIFDSPLIETVEAIILMAHYRSSAGERYSRDSTWTLIGLGAKLAITIGLHRDPARWKMDEKTVNIRRRIFWEIYATDMFFDIYEPVIKMTLAAQPPSYKMILELDRKVREKILPPGFSVLKSKEDASPSAYLQAGILSQIIVGSIVTRAPSSNMAPDAFLELTIAIDLFAKGAEHSIRARRAMVGKVKDKASILFAISRGSESPPPTLLSPPFVSRYQDSGGAMDELAIFGGQTRVLFSKVLTQERAPNWDGPKSQVAKATAIQADSPLEHPLHSAFDSDNSSSPASRFSAEPEDMRMQMHDVHPSLMEYMSMVSSTTPSVGFTGYPHTVHTQLQHPSGHPLAPVSAENMQIPMPDFFSQHWQPPSGFLTQNAQPELITPVTNTQYDSTLFGPFEQFYQEAAPTRNIPGGLNAWNMKDINNLDMVTTDLEGDGLAMDDRWMAFLNGSEIQAPPQSGP
ncbi:hypothetical protein HWV62_9883 [Athelia sp. TMB]|nr:hypothetical protein HWV62_9883 [Athelia sp. TMB]